MKIFLSSASEDIDIAEQVALALGRAHEVFFDRSRHPWGHVLPVVAKHTDIPFGQNSRRARCPTHKLRVSELPRCMN